MIENRFFEAATQGKNEGWRYAVTILLIILAFFLASVLLGIILVIVTQGNLDLNRIAPVPMLLLAMLPFPAGLAALAGGVIGLHRRPFRSLITPEARIRWGRLIISGALWAVVAAAGDMVTGLLLMPGNYVWNFDARAFLPYALLALVLIPLQASTEELIFRGYLMQGLGLLARKNPVIPLLVTSTIFGLLHSLNTEVAAYGLGIMMVYYIGFGLLLGGITLRSQGLEAALGIHIANNLYSTLLITFPGTSLPAPALFRMLEYDPVLGLVVFVSMAAVYLALFSALGWGRASQTLPVVTT